MQPKMTPIAQALQSQGRGNDSMLVHMTPGEVKGLQALALAHGGSLTINPNTGLPEAGFLSSLLPMVAGVALNFVAPGLGAPLSAALIGGGTALMTGSLKKGLMAGLGAFGGYGLGQGLSAAGAETISNLPTEVVSAATPSTSAATVPDVAAQLTTPATDVAAQQTAQQVAQQQAIVNQAQAQQAAAQASGVQPGAAKFFEASGTQAIPQGGMTVAPGQQPGLTSLVNAQQNVAAMPQVVQAPPPVENARDALLARGEPMQLGTYSPTTSEGFSGGLRGIQNVFSGGERGVAAREAFMDASGGPTGLLTKAGSMLVSAEPEQKTDTGKYTPYIRPYTVDVVNNSALGSTYMPGATQERQMVQYTFNPQPIYEAASGGLASLASGGTATKKKSKKIGGTPYYKFAQDRRDSSMEGALEANFASGGQPRFLSGGGDGMSDDIPATIDNKHPARLADGEFVVPADVVSHLGNGSSKAGAKKLYKMMDRIRHARTGKKSQAPEVKAEGFMPA